MSEQFAVDRRAVAFIALTCSLVWFPIVAGVIWRLGVFDLPNSDWVARGLAVGVLASGVYVPWIAFGQIRDAVGIRVDAQGILRGQSRVRWDEITAVEHPGWGTVRICVGERKILIQTYMFGAGAKLERFILSQVASVG